MAAGIFWGSIAHVWGSMSTNTGIQLLCKTAVAVEDHEYAGTIISLPHPHPRAATHMCSAAVPEFVLMAYSLRFH